MLLYLAISDMIAFHDSPEEHLIRVRRAYPKV